jgi:hypothetical protein
MLPKNKTVQAMAANKGMQERTDRLGCCGMEDSSLEDRERGRTGGREGDAGTRCARTESNFDEEEKEAGNKKRGVEERTREAGEKDGGRGKVRGEKEKASRKGERGEEERPANGGRAKKRERGEGGRERERREKGQHIAQKMEGKGSPVGF